MIEQASPVIYYTHLAASPAGALWLAVTDKGLFAIEFNKPEADFLQILKKRSPQAILRRDEVHTSDILRQLNEYFQGQRQAFELSVDLSGIPAFQQAALRATLAIPHGQTATYAEVANAIGHPGAARAVGRAQATNPIPLVIPCHRVVGSDGKLHGYGGPGGITLKAKLLEMERTKQ